MKFELDNRHYELLRGSDVVRDGMYLELNDITNGSFELVMDAFWSDADGSFTFSAYRQHLPFALVEVFVQQAREKLPPIKQDDRR